MGLCDKELKSLRKPIVSNSPDSVAKVKYIYSAPVNPSKVVHEAYISFSTTLTKERAGVTRDSIQCRLPMMGFNRSGAFSLYLGHTCRGRERCGWCWFWFLVCCKNGKVNAEGEVISYTVSFGYL